MRPRISAMPLGVSIAALLLALASACGSTDERGEDIGDPGHHLAVELGDRSYDIFAPEEADGGEAIPAVLVLHGMPAGPAEARSASGMDEAAVEEGFLAVYPEGTDEQWSAEPGSPDVDFIEELIDDLVDAWNADPERIYVSGFSNGADMALVVGAQLPDRLAGVAPVAPSGTGRVMQAVDEAESPLPTVAFLGGDDARLDTGRELMEGWRSGAGCGDEETTEEEGLATSTWQCAEGTEIAVHVLEGQGHTWFGDADRPEPLWASAALWEFFTAQG